MRAADMRVARASAAVVALDGYLYAVGGFDGADWLHQARPSEKLRIQIV